MATADVHHRPAPLLPAGHRWGQGAGSVSPYLREVWSARPNNPVFTPEHFATVVWRVREPGPFPQRLPDAET
jgi:hypothetical protein